MQLICLTRNNSRQYLIIHFFLHYYFSVATKQIHKLKKKQQKKQNIISHNLWPFWLIKLSNLDPEAAIIERSSVNCEGYKRNR